MPPAPEPPDVEVLRHLPPSLHVVAAGTLLWRIYKTAGPHPSAWNSFRAYGPLAACRFDHHPPPPAVHPTRIAYAAERGPTCFAEGFQDTRVIDRKLHAPRLVAFRLTRAVGLLDLTGAWLTSAGASQEVNFGPRILCQRWSRAIHEAYPAVEGLRYPSRMSGGDINLALYERAEDALAALPESDLALDDPGLSTALANAAMAYGYAIV